jgi:hypothetical protein
MSGRTSRTPSQSTSPETSVSDTSVPKKRKRRIPSIKCPQCNFKAKLVRKYEGRRANRTELWGEYRCFMMHTTEKILKINVDK